MTVSNLAATPKGGHSGSIRVREEETDLRRLADRGRGIISLYPSPTLFLVFSYLFVIALAYALRSFEEVFL
jgi:hypothetical protein